MKKKTLLYLIPAIVLMAVYFGLYHKNKDLKYIPDSADAAIIIDVKNITRQYLVEALTHPSVWFKDGKKKDKISWSDAGVRIPDFIQIFHLKNDEISNWNAVFEITDQEELLLFLKNRQFQPKGNGLFSNGIFSIKISGEHCMIGTSGKSFSAIEKALDRKKNIRNADDFMNDGSGGLGIFDKDKTEKYSIHLEDYAIEISDFKNFKPEELSLIKDQSQDFLKAKLDQKNLQQIAGILKTDIFSDPNIESLQLVSDLKQETDTLISYDYDENFNEVEKVSYQKITQPQYQIQIKSENPGLVLDNFRRKKKVDEKQQFTGIPFLPNEIVKYSNAVFIRSKKHPELKDYPQKNFVLIKNNPLLFASLKTLSPNIRKRLDEAESVFYLNEGNQYLLRVQFKQGNLPLILR
ncbi:hypothetical protein ASG31_03540 [Chryseobacterium sp. Leaf404]|uniref:hypothetical protein n=1 Tax=unclassified Chryseobacterium TaxID=2593645 RepID=UPI0006F2363E|nr:MULTISPECIES: hypothetical protein [unclassified Chryseobacterium]KQT22410.1 hypothetical protein ASG31_03540 [Chryseobacterium sp. Leaf404]